MAASTALAAALPRRGQAQAAPPNTAPMLDAPGSAVLTTPIAKGPFQPTWDSLAQYRTPEWFRDAKFGIWAHWTAQSVPGEGDWYARNMYEESDAANSTYQSHIRRYGHPSKVGFKEMDHIWKAENWDPDHLIGLYRAAGAKYFVALANHHDNFDCFDSTHQPWNATRVGPMKDLVGGWARAARAAGLHFGITVHAARTWNWFEPAQGADTHGPLAGVPYDGRLTRADGQGQWWEGLDPQALYAQNHPLGAKPDQAYVDKFYLRCRDLIDKYNPDLLYFDDGVMPLRNVSQAGLHIAAHLYNSNMARHGGRLGAVMNTKGLGEKERRCLVWDIERSESSVIEPFAWQTDTCIGEWHYATHLFLNHGYKTADTVVKMLCDIVSKNGNLLLNIPLPGDGAPDADEVKFLGEMAAWMTVNGDAIYGTRPWKIYGEGPMADAVNANVKDAGFREGKGTPYTPHDMRFVQKGGDLYALMMGWPEGGGTVTIKSLATHSPQAPGQITGVALLGAPGPLKFTRDANGLTLTLPAQKPGDHAYAFKISGEGIAA